MLATENKTHLFAHISIDQKFSWAHLDSLFRGHKSEMKVLAGWALTWRPCGRIQFQVYSDCWQNSDSCNCRVEVTIFLLTVR